jgi:hypothetical protein
MALVICYKITLQISALIAGVASLARPANNGLKNQRKMRLPGTGKSRFAGGTD